MAYPKTDKGWAGYAARIMKTTKPYGLGGYGLGRRFDAPFEGGTTNSPADADRVVGYLRTMVREDSSLAAAVLRHHYHDGSGIVGLAELAAECWPDLAHYLNRPKRLTWAELMA